MNNKTIIISNNSNTSNQLENWMGLQMPNLQLIGKANNTNEGLKMLQQKQPELVFVNLEDLTAEGFIKLKQIQNQAFSIIFVTDAFMNGDAQFPAPILNVARFKKPGIQLKVDDATKHIPYQQIIRLEACSNYTQFYLSQSAKPILTSKTLKFYVNELDENTFVRPHQSHLINRNFIDEVVLKPTPHLVLNNGVKISIARRKIGAFKKVD